jgi:hypothetical protein
MPGWPEWLQEELGLGDLVSQVPVQLGRATTGASTPRCLGWGRSPCCRSSSLWVSLRELSGCCSTCPGSSAGPPGLKMYRQSLGVPPTAPRPLPSPALLPGCSPQGSSRLPPSAGCWALSMLMYRGSWLVDSTDRCPRMFSSSIRRHVKLGRCFGSALQHWYMRSYLGWREGGAEVATPQQRPLNYMALGWQKKYYVTY